MLHPRRPGEIVAIAIVVLIMVAGSRLFFSIRSSSRCLQLSSKRRDYIRRKVRKYRGADYTGQSISWDRSGAGVWREGDGSDIGNDTDMGCQAPFKAGRPKLHPGEVEVSIGDIGKR